MRPQQFVQRAKHLLNLCGQDESLKTEVESLLAHDTPTPEPLIERLSQSSSPPSLGVMLNEGRDVLTQAPWAEVFPGLAVAITVLAFTLIGDGLRRRLDPRGMAR